MSPAASLRRVLVLLVFAAAPALATTIVPVSDSRLVDRSPLVVQVRIEEKLPGTSARPVTDWLVGVERVLKGRLGTSRIVVRLPGGRGPDGWSLHVWGTPAFAPGRRAILFLLPGREGTWAIADFPQGAFLTLSAGSRALSVRDLSEVRVVRAGKHASRERYIDTARFADWIEDRASGNRRPADYLVRSRAGELRSLVSAFTLIEHEGLPFRWAEFDGGLPVTFRSHAGGQPGLAGGGVAQVQEALAAWNREPTTPIQLLYGGTTDAANGFESFDEQNVVLWNDPNDEIAGSFSCYWGGVVAFGGPWYRESSRVLFNGRNHYAITAGDVVLNDGLECRGKRGFDKFIEQVVGHEIGHTLGLGHSSENPKERNRSFKDALMYYRIHADKRGAALAADDIAGLQTLYRVGGAIPGGGGGSGGGGTTKGCPAGTPAGTLCLLQGRFRVTATWENQFNSSKGTAGVVPSTDFSGFLYFADPTNLELAVKILDFGSEIKIFYSQLTNLRFTLSVTDSSTGRVKTYTNTSGECGAIDNNFLLGATAGSTLGAVALPSVADGKCVADATTLCLLGGRFAATVDWRNQFDGSSGAGKPKPLSSLTGAFSFGDPNNLELLIKTLDFGDHQLVLYGALSNLEYTIRVTEAASGRTKTYANAAGSYCGGIDNNF